LSPAFSGRSAENAPYPRAGGNQMDNTTDRVAHAHAFVDGIAVPIDLQ